ncbi:hypothetical protein LTS18_011772 [Coniosporium uncinatum]|uniref:Uncharacterized protein n=1 Tax=Coniosporium uncinatum TaxID=93489 RepID=A0ACC3D9F8_9PEZI|nr:hypothetical protein LTS18_011772 [Coniosporium uncinatum]
MAAIFAQDQQSLGTRIFGKRGVGLFMIEEDPREEAPQRSSVSGFDPSLKRATAETAHQAKARSLVHANTTSEQLSEGASICGTQGERQAWPTAAAGPSQQPCGANMLQDDRSWRERLLRPFRVLDYGHRAVRQVLDKRQAPWGTEYKVAWEDTWVPEAVLLKQEYAVSKTTFM